MRRFDPERFRTVLFAPPERRSALFALYAFNLEIAKAREVVSQPVLGQVRLQWWREAIEGIYDGAPRRHAVVLALAEAIGAHELTRSRFDRLIDARETDMADQPPDSMAALVDYADGTSAALTGLALEALDADMSAAGEAGRHVGIAWALVGLLRAVPFHARAKRLYLPADRLAATGVSIPDLFELRPQSALNAVVAEIAATAKDRLAKARALRPEVPGTALPALLPARLADGHLEVLRRADWNPFDPQVAPPLPSASWRLLFARLTGRF